MELLLSSAHCEDSPKEFMTSWGTRRTELQRRVKGGEKNKADVRVWLCGESF